MRQSPPSLPESQAAGGAVVGALVAGPFGALVGGWLGKGAGMSNKAEEEELSRVGYHQPSRYDQID